MNKAYLAGFIAGTTGKTWDDCPFSDQYCFCAVQWRYGCDHGQEIAFGGNEYTGRESVEEGH